MAYELNLAPKALSEQCAAFKKAHPTLDDLPAEDYVLQAKYDGCLAIINTRNRVAYTRTGELINSMDHIVKWVAEMFPHAVVFGEAYIPNTPFKDISGKFRRHANQPDLGLVMFDIVPVEDWYKGMCNKPYSERLSELQSGAWAAYAPRIIVAQTVSLAQPGAFARDLVAHGGYDGAIIRRKSAGWRTGASKNGEAIKVKPVQSLDLEVHGWFRGKGKHANRAGGITVLYRGVQTDVGTGFTDREREEIAAAGQAPCGIAEVEFMELTADGKLREPRFKGWRYDKEQPDT